MYASSPLLFWKLYQSFLECNGNDTAMVNLLLALLFSSAGHLHWDGFKPVFFLVQQGNRNPNRSHHQTRAQRKRVAAEKEEQRRECALTFEKSRSKRYKACSDVVPVTGIEPVRILLRGILSYKPHVEGSGFYIHIKECKNSTFSGLLRNKFLFTREKVYNLKFPFQKQKCSLDSDFCTSAVTARYFFVLHQSFITAQDSAIDINIIAMKVLLCYLVSIME